MRFFFELKFFICSILKIVIKFSVLPVNPIQKFKIRTHFDSSIKDLFETINQILNQIVIKSLI